MSDKNLSSTLRMLLVYKAWANEQTFASVAALPAGEALRERQTRFGNIVHTLNHVYVVDDIFRHHLEGRRHGYTARNTGQTPTIDHLWRAVTELNQWYLDLVGTLSADALAEVIRFEYVGGGEGAMTREQILLHLVNHGTYHRGFVSDLMYQIPAALPTNDLTVFLRDRWSAVA
jgi:uncharacterized damage-inducible protein DinB